MKLVTLKFKKLLIDALFGPEQVSYTTAFSVGSIVAYIQSNICYVGVLCQLIQDHFEAYISMAPIIYGSTSRFCTQPEWLEENDKTSSTVEAGKARESSCTYIRLIPSPQHNGWQYGNYKRTSSWLKIKSVEANEISDEACIVAYAFSSL